MTLKSIAILYNARIGQACPLAEEVAAWLRRRGRQGQVCEIGKASDILRLREIDLVVTLGGDGSILHAARLAAPYGSVILGINLGRVGFLTEADPDGWESVLSRTLEGDYWVEERMMLHMMAWRDDWRLAQAHALNEVVVGRGTKGRAAYLRTEVDGGDLATYVGDGLIVATPTGSTAYALAAGGPILPPELRNILLVPVAPHLSMGRPIVLAEGVSVRTVVAGGRSAVLTVDGQVEAELRSGDEVVVEASPHLTRFARVQERKYFYKTLVARLVPRDRFSDLSQDV